MRGKWRELMPLLLVLGYVWPEPNSSAAGWRMLSLLQLFQRQGWQIVFASAADKSPHRADLSQFGIEEVKIALNCDSFAVQLQQWQPAAVLFDRFMLEEQFGWWVDEICPQALKLLDSEDLHCLRAARQRAFNEQRPVNNADLTDELALREIAAIHRCDLTLTISRAELQLLTDFYQVPAAQLLYCPFLIENCEVDRRHGFAQRQHFSFIGNFRHEPNWQAVLRLKRLWPALRKQLPEAELHIYGAYPPPKATQLHAPKQGFFLKGWAAQAADAFLSYRVCLAPLSFGAGLKGKIIDAMSFGTPVVTTWVGAEGISHQTDYQDFPGIVADDDQTLIAAAVALYQDQSQWLQARYKAEACLAQFDAALLMPQIWQQLTAVQQQLASHRQQSFTGQMLKYHLHRSTKFMAQWISAKNKLAALQQKEPSDGAS
jgi:glycosyltransferase involved in cell wall biosynthesis